MPFFSQKSFFCAKSPVLGLKNGPKTKDFAHAKVRSCDAWIVDWATGPPVVSPTKPVRVVEYDHDDKFRHLGYTASLTGHGPFTDR